MKAKTLMNIFIVLLLVSFVSVSFATAEININTNVNTVAPDYSFVVMGNQNIKACNCGTLTDSITIKNTGTYNSIFYVSVDKQYISVSESSFELAPGASKLVQINADISCNAWDFKYNLDIKNSFGKEQIITKSVNLEKCQNLELWISGNNQEISPCTKPSLTLYVKNTGLFSEDYTLSSNRDNIVSYTSNKFTLEPNQIALINTTLNLSCEDFGTQDVLFTARAIKNKLKADIKASVKINSDYSYDILANDHYSVCNREILKIPVTVQNYGIWNEFTMQINAPAFVGIEGPQTFKLDRNEKQTFNVVIDATNIRKDNSSHTVSISVNEKIGQISKNKNIYLTLGDCVDFSATVEPVSIDTCPNELHNATLNIKNNGKQTGKFEIEMNDTSNILFSITQNNFILLPGESRNVLLFFEGIDKSAIISPVVSVKSSGFNEKAMFTLNSHDMNQCYAAVAMQKNFKINYDYQSIDVNLKNFGLKDDTYVINVESEIAMINDNVISIKSSEEKQLHLLLNTANMSEGNYVVNLSIVSTESDQSFKNVLTIKLKDKNILRKVFEYLAFGSICRQFSLYQIAAILIVCALIIYFIFFGPKYPYKLANRIKMKTPILVTLIAILLAGLVFVLMFYGLPKSNNEVYNLKTDLSKMHIELLQNQHFTVDASTLFKDPDNNTLKYTVNESLHIKSVEKGNMISFYPDLKWSGEEKIYINAFDTQGGIATSPAITIKVYPYAKKSATEIYNIYCWYFNLAILAIFLILVFILSIVWQKKRTRK